jgi:uncharacterized repeat protein (TIGR03803 family)
MNTTKANNQTTQPSSQRCAVSTLPAYLFGAMLVIASLLQPAQAQTYKVLYSFTGKSDGGFPYGTLIRDGNGNLYGTTFDGGFFDSSECSNGGCGVVYRIDVTGKETVIYTFKGQASGQGSLAGLLRDTQGNLYGTTSLGGDTKCNSRYGCGLVFKIDSTGKESVLYQFAGGNDGMEPESSLIRDAAGNLYGTTEDGFPGNGGTVFKVDAAGNETVLHNFTGPPDGTTPIGALVRDPQGNLYGATELGGTGTACGSLGCGVVYKVTPQGEETILYSFSGGADGSEAADTLIRDSAGNLYGVTGFGGDLACDFPYGCGVVFKVDQTGVETVLFTFTDKTENGWNAIAGVIRDSAGNLYGTTYRGGAYGFGTVYKVDPAGNQTLLHSFAGGADGAYPYAGLVADSAGNLYWTALSSGKSGCGGQGCGVVFKIVP